MRVLTGLIILLAFGLSSISGFGKISGFGTSVVSASDVGQADEESGDSVSADLLDFNQDIRPLLSDRCFSCHGPDAEHRQADLRLDDEESAKAYAIEVGNPEESLIIERIRSSDPEMMMPPPETGKQLSEQEIEKLERWITAGANYATHWAYVPPTRHAVPEAQQASELATGEPAWCKSWIDRFVLAKLNKTGLKPAEDVDPIDLLRRVSYDLTGLPPSSEMVEAMTNDPSELTYGRLVDRLLASPRFGERMASLWFDLVRYADTVGYHGDQDHNIAPYRDWVIDAFNSNMPFDQFSREQLAGDLLENSTVDQKIASGYNRLLQTTHEGGLQPKEYLAIYAADRVRNVSAVWMGATLGCAQCHDHKYDPYTAKDFYAMAAFFADIDEQRHFREGSNALPTNRPPEIEVLRPRQRRELRELEQRIEQLEDEADQPRVADQLAGLLERRKQLQGHSRKTMITVAIEPREIRVLPRGNWLDESGPVVQPAVPEFLGRDLAGDSRASRLDLANWLVDVSNGHGGLTARVMVNRIWAMLFGHGLSRSPEDFGGQGEPPTHPALLDNLAVEFYSRGWDLKQIVREIVLSRTYRLSSSLRTTDPLKNPGNRLLAAQNRFRLPAETIRDQALLLGGLLVLEDGGKSSRPYQPVDYYRHLNFPPRTYSHDRDGNQYRRGVYVHWQRQFLHPMLRAFDAPSREECTARRPTSNTPLAALTLMNDPTFVEAARGLAARLLDLEIAPGEVADRVRINMAFGWALARDPKPFELDVLQKSLEIARQEFSANPEDAKAYLKTGMVSFSGSQDAVELAAWTEVARTIFNLSEWFVRP